jgi:hypothetical protein
MAMTGFDQEPRRMADGCDDLSGSKISLMNMSAFGSTRSRSGLICRGQHDRVVFRSRDLVSVLSTLTGRPPFFLFHPRISPDAGATIRRVAPAY